MVLFFLNCAGAKFCDFVFSVVADMWYAVSLGTSFISHMLNYSFFVNNVRQVPCLAMHFTTMTNPSLADSMGAKLDSVELHIISIKAAAANGSWADLGTLSSKLLRKLQHPRPP